MKSSVVSFMLLLAACEWPEPMAPVPTLTSVSDSVVITGRVVSAGMSQALHSANVRVLEAKASVGTGATGHFRIALPPSYRGRAVPLQVRAIGFKPRQVVRTVSDNMVVDFTLTADTLGFSCEMPIQASSAYRRGDEDKALGALGAQREK